MDTGAGFLAKDPLLPTKLCCELGAERAEELWASEVMDDDGFPSSICDVMRQQSIAPNTIIVLGTKI